jgi:peptidase E
MNRRDFLVKTAFGSMGALAAFSTRGLIGRAAATRKILIAGGNYNTIFIKYMADLTGKTRPKLLYLPTASADSPNSILGWYRNVAPLNVEALVQESFIASTRQTRSWEEVLLSVDGIVVSGGNTLNQQAIWKAQGIDVVLRKAWDQGIVLGGASAGSLCWFEEGTAGIYFEDNTVKRVVATRRGPKVYYVSVSGGQAVEKPFEPEIIS